MFISPFTPLFFNIPKADGIESEYIQTFAPTDRILLQIISLDNEEIGCITLYSEPGHIDLGDLEYRSWQINDELRLDFVEISPSPGLYTIGISGGIQSAPFRVTDDPLILEDTTLIQYSMKNNRQRRDAIFFIDGMQYFFDWRVPGGFKDSNWSFGVESEQFVTPTSDIAQLYGLESTVKQFTLGGSMGVPVWFGEMLNRILVCSHVYFDGVKYTRKESSTPELTVQLEGVNSFVFNQSLQQSVNLDPVIEAQNRLIMRRTNRGNYRRISTNINRKI